MVSSLGDTLARRLTGRSRRRGWPFMYEVVVGTLRRNFLHSATLPVDEARRFNDAVAAAQPFKHAVDRTRDSIGQVAVERFSPRGAQAENTLLYLHGGSYIMGSANTHADLIGRLAALGPFETLAVDYRLAPEHTIADAVEDVCAVFRALVEQGRDPKRIVFAGDSAGGGLAFLAAIALRDAGDRMPAAIGAIAPWSDLRCSHGSSFQENEAFDWGTAAVLRSQAEIAAQGIPLDDPRISPRFAELRGLPPVLLHAGDAEIVRDAVVDFAEALKAAGVDTTLRVWPDMVHDFHLMADFHPLAQQASEELAAFLRDRCGDAA